MSSFGSERKRLAFGPILRASASEGLRLKSTSLYLQGMQRWERGLEFEYRVFVVLITRSDERNDSVHLDRRNNGHWVRIVAAHRMALRRQIAGYTPLSEAR
jgi:hypothetical protein